MDRGAGRPANTNTALSGPGLKATDIMERHSTMQPSIASRAARLTPAPKPHSRSNSGSISNRRIHTIPQRLQIRIVNAGALNRFVINQDCLLEPVFCVINAPELRAVAREIVGDHPEARELFGDRQQVVKGRLRALEFVQVK